MIAQHEQQHAETMLATHQLRARRAGADRAAAAGRRRGARAAAPRCWCPAARSPWAPPSTRGRWTTSGPAHQVQVAGVLASTPRRSPTPTTRTSSPTAATTDPRWWHPDGWQHVAAGRAGRAAVLEARRRRVAARAGSAARAGAAGRARACTSAGTRPTPTPAGPASGCRPRRSGRRPPGTTRSTGRSRRYPVGRRRPDPRAGQPRPAPPAPAAGRRVPGRRLAAGHPPADRRRLGVDVQRLRAATRGSAPGRTGSTRRCSSAASTRCCAAAPSAADRVACRGTFRNWDYPIRRQIFAGFRCARDAAPEQG